MIICTHPKAGVEAQSGKIRFGKRLPQSSSLEAYHATVNCGNTKCPFKSETVEVTMQGDTILGCQNARAAARKSQRQN